jgi:hypothetical protein
MSNRIEQVTRDLAATADDVSAAFDGLSGRQLNWKPAEKSWSVAQCLDHLITTHEMYFPMLERMAAGTYAPSFWAKISPLSAFFGRYLAGGLDPANQKKMKTTSKALPSASDIDDGIVSRYLDHQGALIDHLNALPVDMDPRTTMVTSPLMGAVTYSLDDTMTILVFHGQRHFLQAKRVTQSAGFPAVAAAV